MEQPLPDVRRDGLRNILRNLAWLLGGKGFAAVISLVYIAILSRSLGVKDFGHFSLIFGTAQALVAIASFQTWQTLVRFGAKPVTEKNWPQFGRLTWLCGAIDVSGAVVGCVIAFVVFYGFGHTLQLNPRYIDMAFAFNCALLWSRMTAPNGVVRVLDRFDIGSYVEAVVPAGRLIAALIILFVGPTVGRFLFAWALLDLLSGALYWYAAWRLAPEAMSRANFGKWRQAMEENPGLGAFFGITYGNSTLDALTKQGPLLAVGYFLGTSAAGVYRLADQLAQSIGKFAQLVARAVFPEFVHAQIGSDAEAFRRMVRRVTIIAGIGGVVVTVCAMLLGGPLLDLVGGDAFATGASILLPLAIGASFELASVSYEPMFYATGHASYPLIVRSVTVVAVAVAIVAMVGMGAAAVGWAVALGMAIGYALFSILAWVVLRELAAHKAPK
ncbi:MAG: lipopolysaccharide biosynthesis protein [Sphingomonadales bacterium]|nr:lipopolysaccharide biosynthesis protein [Sphingomonadales bacterium]MBD3772266.1 lipopolysaccharide biosynthesis protein [Paracoccaceae bacterium]